MTGARSRPWWAGEPAPVCVAVGGRAGAQVQTLVQVLTRMLADAGPVVLGALAPSNRPGGIDQAVGAQADEGDGETAVAAHPTGTAPLPASGAADDPDRSAPPIDVLVQVLHGAAQASDLRMLQAHRSRGTVVIAAVVTGARAAGRAPAVQSLPGAAAGGEEGRSMLTVHCGPAGRIDAASGGVEVLVAGLRAAIGVLLAARADRMLTAGARAATYGPDRTAAERALHGAPARRLRATGRRCWDDSAGDARRAVALAAWYRAAAAGQADPERAQRARDWSHRYVDRAVALGAPVRGRGPYGRTAVTGQGGS